MNLKITLSLLALAAIIGQGTPVQPLLANAQETLDGALKVASVIQRPAAQEDVMEGTGMNAPVPDAPENQGNPDLYTIDVADGSQFEIQVMPVDETAAGVFVNAVEVIRFRFEAGGLSPQDRARASAKRLYETLVSGELIADDIRPAYVNKQFVLKFGNEVLATVDAKTAKAAKTAPARLAYLWGNQVRDALGASPLDEKEYKKLANQGLPAYGNYRATGQVQTGEASWYGPGFHGRRTSSGARFNMYAMTAAHRHLPFGTLVRVTNKRNNRSCIVKITDRGPFAHGRIIDLSKGAAQAIGMSGVARVKLEVVKPES